MGIKPQVVKAAIPATRPYVSCDFSERLRSPHDESDRLADKIDIAVFYFTEQTCGQGGSAAPRAMLIQLGFADAYNIEVRGGLALLLDPPTPLLCRDLRHEREKCSVTIMLHAVVRDKAQRRRINRVSLSGWRCGIDNQMSKMRIAALGPHFDAMHVVRIIVLFGDRIFRDRI